MKSDLDTKGYVIFRNALSQSEIETGKSFIEDGKVLYTKMTAFIQKSMIGKLNEIMDWDAQYVKYRVSDNNNSSDASAFHRDIIYQDRQKEYIYPVYTLLSYLDKTVMELIPTSHISPVGNYTDALRTYKLKETITMNPGDLILFASTMLHRGIFTERLPYRRLIQVFEIFPDKELYEKYANKFLHIPSPRPKLSALSVFFSRFKLSTLILNIYGYLNAFTGYGYHPSLLQKYNVSNFTYLASEGLQGRVNVEPYQWQTINRYILSRPLYDFPEMYRKQLKFIQYTRQHILYSAVILILGFFLFVGLLMIR